MTGHVRQPISFLALFIISQDFPTLQNVFPGIECAMDFQIVKIGVMKVIKLAVRTIVLSIILSNQVQFKQQKFSLF